VLLPILNQKDLWEFLTQIWVEDNKEKVNLIKIYKIIRYWSSLWRRTSTQLKGLAKENDSKRCRFVR
jgi:hypothetical protein